MSKVLGMSAFLLSALFVGAANASTFYDTLNNWQIVTGIGGTIITNPVATPGADTYTSEQDVALSANGAPSIHYTFDGTAPDCISSGSSLTYSVPIPVSESLIIKAISCYPNNLTSSIVSFDYIINLPAPTLPTASPVAGTYTSAQSVVLISYGSDSIHYTTNGVDPTCSTGTTYSSAISVSATLTMKAIACYGESYSDVATFAYTINIPPSPSGGVGGGTPPPPITKIGDANGDSKVDKYDFSLMMSKWGQTGSSLSGDFNKDGKVDKYDFALLMLNWNK